MANRAVLGVAGFIVGFGLIAGVSYISLKHDMDKMKASMVELVKVEYSGGLCQTDDGAGKICSSTETIYTSGLYTGGSKLSETEIVELERLIEQSDLNSIPPNQNPNCPSFSDGQDLSFVYPTKYDEQRFTLCQLSTAETDPLLSYTTKLVTEHTK